MKKEADRRTLKLAAESSRVRDKWVAAIDYLKTKAIYDAYSKSNQLVNFMGPENDKKEDQDADELDVNELLYDFGGKLK